MSATKKQPPINPDFAAVTGVGDAEISEAAAIESSDALEPSLDWVDAVDFHDNPPPPPKWIVPDLIANEYKGAIFGKSKSRKTFFSRQLALSIALGERFLNFSEPTSPHKVLYIDLELLKWNSWERDAAQRGEAEKRGWKLAKGRLYYWHLRGRTSILRSLFYKINPNNHQKELDPDNAFVRKVKSLEIEIIFIDPRYKLMEGNEDENTAVGMRTLLEFRELVAALTGCAVVVVGHDPKGDVSKRGIADRGSGSYVSVADDDCTITLTPNNNETNAVTVESMHRARAVIPPFAATFDNITQTFTHDPSVSVVDPSELPKTNEGKALRNAARFQDFKEAALEVADEAGEKPLGTEEFKRRLNEKPKGAIGVINTNKFFKSLIENKVLAQDCEWERDENGNIKRGRCKLVSTPQKLAAYLATFGKTL